MNYFRNTERGAAAVEFALVLPLLVMLLMGVMDFGHLTSTRITLVEAV